MASDQHEARRSLAKTKVDQYEATITASITAALAIQRAKTPKFNHGTPPPDPFDLATWNETVQTNVQPAVTNVFTDVVKDVLIASGIGYSLSKLIGQSPVGSTLNDATGKLVTRVGAIGENVGTKLTMGIMSADTDEELDQIVSKVFTSASTSASYLARAVNLFANQLAVQAAQTVHPEIPMQKTWTAIEDAVTRIDHSDADGQTVAVDQPFIVGGFEGMYPGDADLPDEETINCRCWVVIEQQAA